MSTLNGMMLFFILSQFFLRCVWFNRMLNRVLSVLYKVSFYSCFEHNFLLIASFCSRWARFLRILQYFYFIFASWMDVLIFDVINNCCQLGKETLFNHHSCNLWAEGENSKREIPSTLTTHKYSILRTVKRIESDTGSNNRHIVYTNRK